MFCCAKQSPSPSNLKSLLSQKTCLCGKENINTANSSLPTNISDSGSGNKLAIKCRSKKIKIENDYEISFEKGILADHKISFKNIFSNYSKQVTDLVQFSQFNILQIHNQNNQLQDSFDSSQLSKFVEACEILNEQEQNQFIQDLKSEENLSNFIIYMLKNICEQAKSELVFVISFIWEEYLIQTKSACKIKNLIDKIRSLMRSKITEISRHCIYLTCGDKVKKSPIQVHFTTLINSLIESIVLVIEGYFESSAQNINDDILVPTGKFSQLSLESK